MALMWECTDLVVFDDTMLFGKGYDFEGLECLREEAETPLGRFVVWPDCLGSSKNWSLYGGTHGWFETGFQTKEAAQAEVERLTTSSAMSAHQ